MVDYLKRLFDRFDAKYETFRDDFEAEYFLQKNALAMIRLRRESGLTQTEFARNAVWRKEISLGSKKEIIILRSRIFKKLRVKMGMI